MQYTEENFIGGITDYYLDGDPRKYAKADNWLITKDGTLTVRNGCTLHDVNYPRANANRVGKLHFFLDTMFLASHESLFYYDENNGWVELVGPASEKAFVGADQYSTYSFVTMNNNLLVTSDKLDSPIRKVYKDTGGNWKIFTAGLETIPWASGYPTFTPSINEGKSYLYFFVPVREYTVQGDVVFRDVGPVSGIKQVTSAPDFSVSSPAGNITIQAATGSSIWPTPGYFKPEVWYDNANLYIYVYRTRTDGSVGYLTKKVLAGHVGTIVDNTADINLGEEIYIAGDVLDWDPPPRAKYLAQVKDIVWAANVKEFEGDYLTGEWKSYPYRIRQSVLLGQDKFPASFYTDVDGDITGFNSVGDYVVVGTIDKLWRLEGYVDYQGSGFVRKILISDSVGIVNNDSVIRSEKGLAFAGKDGFYFTDGFQVVRISDDLTLSYPNIVNSSTFLTKEQRRKRISGAYDRRNDRYYWCVMTNIDHTDNDYVYIWDANYGVVPNGSFTTMHSVDDMYPTSIAFEGDNMYRGDARGYVFVHKPVDRNDVVVGAAGNEANWHSKAIPYDFITCARSMGDTTMTKWTHRAQFIFINVHSDISMLASTADDDTKTYYPLKEMRFRGHYHWGQEELIWGDPNLIWDYRSFIFFERRMPAGSIRNTYKQIRLTPAFTVIMASDDGYVGGDLGLCDATAKTVILPGPAVWGADLGGYYFYYEYNGYIEGFKILSSTPTTLVVEDPYDKFVSGNFKWEVRGQRKNERPVLKNIVMLYEPFGDSQQGWKLTDKAGNV